MTYQTGYLPPASNGQIETATLQLLRVVQGRQDSSPNQNSPTENAIPSLLQLANEFLLTKARSGQSEGYLELLVKQIRAFTTGREARANIFSGGQCHVVFRTARRTIENLKRIE